MEENDMELPETGFLRLPQIIGDKKAVPPIPALIPISRSTFLAAVRDGRIPKPVKLSRRCSAWRVRDILNWIEKMSPEAALCNQR
jgi:prophage regulatory protein